MQNRLKTLCLGFLSVLLLAGCAGKGSDEPFFELRGVVVCWDDIKNPEVID